MKLNRDDCVALCPAGVFDGIAGGLSRSMQARRILGAAGTDRKGQCDLFGAGPAGGTGSQDRG